jgi:predicted dinucleotide-binding enzyme
MSVHDLKTIAVLGPGRVGTALAGRLLIAGAKVRFGGRSADHVSPLAGVPRLSFADAAAGADAIVLAVPALAAVEVLRQAAPAPGTTVIDCTNPVTWTDGPVWTPPSRGSVAQALAEAFPTLAVVKGFNHFGAEIQANPAMPSGPADAFFASDDAEAKKRVVALAGAMGFRGHDAGPLRNAGLLESLAVLWIHLAAAGAGRTFAFRLERR